MGDIDNNGFLDLLYSAPLEPDLWVRVMERFADMIGGTKSSLSQFDLSNGVGPRITARADPVNIPRYLHFADRNPLNNVTDPGGYARSWSLRILTDEDWMPKEDFLATEYYNDFLEPQRIHSLLMVRLALRGRAPSVLNICRPPGAEQFGGAEREIAGHFHPHLVRAFALSEKLASARWLSDGVTDGLDASPHGVMFLDDAGTIRHVNRIAERAFHACGGLSSKGGRLTATNPNDARRLLALIGAAGCAYPERRTAGSMALQADNGSLPLSITVSPLRSADRPIFGGPPGVLVCITGLNAGTSPTQAGLRRMFSLTPAESRVAIALFEGLRPSEIAARFGVSIRTVRVQLNAIFGKTNTRRQAELVRRLMSDGI